MNRYLVLLEDKDGNGHEAEMEATDMMVAWTTAQALLPHSFNFPVQVVGVEEL